MGIIEIILIAIGLAMDACAVSVCKGLSMKKMDWKKTIIIGLYFGIFQGGMPLIGYMLGIGFEESIKFIDHWIAFVLLAFIGINMIKEAFSKDEDDEGIYYSLVGFDGNFGEEAMAAMAAEIMAQ